MELKCQFLPVIVRYLNNYLDRFAATRYPWQFIIWNGGFWAGRGKEEVPAARPYRPTLDIKNTGRK